MAERRALEADLVAAFRAGMKVLSSKRSLIESIERELNTGRPDSDVAAPVKSAAAPNGEELKDLTQRLAPLFNEIEVREASLGVAVEALRVARGQADSANRTKTQFLKNMSHELRTPLNAVIGYSEILAEDLEAAGLKAGLDDLARIRAAPARLLEMIDDIMLLTEADGGSISGRMAMTAGRDFAASAAASAASWASEARVTLNFSGSDEALQFDALALRRCVLALLSNATRFTQAGGEVSLKVHTEVCDGGKRVAATVSDNGSGIDPDKLDDLFEIFSQSDISATRARDGAGLGLAVVRKITTQLRGGVSVDSAPGRGSTFVVWLPAATA